MHHIRRQVLERQLCALDGSATWINHKDVDSAHGAHLCPGRRRVKEKEKGAAGDEAASKKGRRL